MELVYRLQEEPRNQAESKTNQGEASGGREVRRMGLLTLEGSSDRVL